MKILALIVVTKDISINLKKKKKVSHELIKKKRKYRI
jgi:hypothetical protein